MRDACQVLREIIAVYDSSLVDAADRSTDAHFANLLEKAVDPAVEMCERMAELRKGSTDWDKDIFLINCLGYLQVGSYKIDIIVDADSACDVQHTLESFPFTAPRVALLEEDVQKHVESMTYEHVGLCS